MTYYISPTGSDSNSGTSSTTPWASVAKVDSTNFAAGDQILFQYGSTWNASLNASSSGSVSAPIVYGAYGNPSLGNPTFSGSDPINTTAFKAVTGTTYSTTPSSPVNWIFDNHQFTHEAQDALTQSGASNPTNPTADLNYVENTPGSFFYNATNNQLYVNTGSTLSGHTITAATRQDAIFSNAQSNLVFQNLNATETAADNGGYAIRIQASSNVRLLNDSANSGGKHNLGAIDDTGFVGINLTASGSAFDQGFGGASAFVAYSDANPGRPNNQNNTYAWTNLTYTNANGAYTAFLSHGDTGAIASLAVNNLVSLNGYGTGISLQSAGPNEVATVQGGHVDGGYVEVDTNNSVVNGMTITGATGSIILGGSHSVAQNNVVNGAQPNLYAGRNGAIVDSGTNNTIRFNVANLATTGPGIGVNNANSATNIYGNIISYSPGTTLGIAQLYTGAGTLTSNYNVYTAQAQFFLQNNYQYLTPQQWQGLGYDVNSLVTNPLFNNASSGDFSLQSNSPALGLYPSGLDSSLATANALIGAAYSNGNYNAGLNYNVAPNLSVLSNSVLLNNGQTATITPTNNTLVIQNAGAMIVLSGSTLDLTGNVTNAGAFIIYGTLIQSGNFTNNSATIISGPQIWAPGSTYTNAAGATTFQTDVGGPVAPAGYLSVIAAGGAITFASTQHLAGLNISSGTTVLVTGSPTGRSILFTPSLTITGTLDLGGNDLEVKNGSLLVITALIKSGYNNGTWTGTGITSSTAANDTTHATALGVILNNGLYGSGTTLGLFDGTSPDVNDVLVRYTYLGDTNLDGKVDGSDYSRIDNGFLTHLTGWYNGDFNYDGVVNGSDYTLIDNAFNTQAARLTASLASPTAESTAQVVVVPEPISILPMLLAMLCTCGRKNRMRQWTGHYGSR